MYFYHFMTDIQEATRRHQGVGGHRFASNVYERICAFCIYCLVGNRKFQFCEFYIFPTQLNENS